MQLVEVIEEILETGVLSRAVEHRMQQLVDSTPMGESEMAAIAQLLEALCEGNIRPVA